MRIMDPMTTSHVAATEVIFTRSPWDDTLSPGAARTIAGWWSSANESDAAITALSQGVEVDPADVLANLTALSEVMTLNTEDRHALAALWTFVEGHVEPAVEPVEEENPYLWPAEWAQALALVPDEYR